MRFWFFLKNDEKFDTLVNRRYPSWVGTDLCSLREKVDRLTFSVVWEVNSDAEVISRRFFKSVIRSRAALSYGEAQTRIDDPSSNDEITQGLRLLLGLSKKLKERRLEAGALSLASPEVKFSLDSETNNPTDVRESEIPFRCCIVSCLFSFSR